MHVRLAAILVGLAVASGCAGSLPRDPGGSAIEAQSPAALAASPMAREICGLLSTPSAALRNVATIELSTLRPLYAPRNCEALWGGASTLTPSGMQLVDRLRKIGAADPTEIAASPAERDLLMSAAFALFVVDPGDPTLKPSPQRLVALVTQAANDPDHLRLALPVDPQVRRLRDALESHRRMALSGGWPRVPEGLTLAMGSRGAPVTMLRDRLRASGDVTEGDVAGGGDDPAVFDTILDAGLRRFQARHGLLVDGVVARETLAALNVPITARIASLAASLRKVSAQQRDWGRRYIAVNIAAAMMTLVEDGRTTAQRRAIVGRPTWRTPELDGVIDRLEFHPYWTVPARIAQLELLPKVRKDKGYLERNHMSIVGGQIRQAPGPDNPLGRVKFIFANPYSVYLHDTSAPELFERPARFLSHGCVRIEQAVDLARRLLRDDPAWPQARIDAALLDGANIRVDLRSPIALHLVYDTAWVDDGGSVNFRKDVYNLDRVATALTGRSGSSPQSACGA